MKAKTLVAMAALALLIGVPARGAEVISSNVVGYQKIEITSQFSLIGAQFVNVGGTVKDINDLFVSNTLAGLDEDYAFQTSLRTWTGTGYQTFVWYDADDGTEAEWEEANGKWLYGDESDIAQRSIQPGEAFWIKTDLESGTLTISGQVPDVANIEPVEINKEFTLIANPLPKDISIQDIVPSATIPGLDENYVFQTSIRTWTGTGYQTFVWYDADDGTEAEWDEANSKWLYGDESDIADKTIHVGEGFWFKTTPEARGTVSFRE